MTGSTTPSDSKKFTTREWIHLIITLSIIQAFIWFVSLKFAGNPSALGYVSFAGTLISIILAVLAIGYTYGESQQQKNSSTTLGNQIESLIKIKEKLEIQADALGDIKDLKNTLVNFTSTVDNHFKETNQNVFEVKNNLITLNQKPSSTISNNLQDLNYEKLLNELNKFDHTYPTVVFSVIGIYCNQAENFENYEGLMKFINESQYGNSDIDASNFMTKRELFGACVMTCNFFIIMGLIRSSAQGVILGDGFIELLRRCENRLQKTNTDGFNQPTLDSLHSELKKIKYFNRN